MTNKDPRHSMAPELQIKNQESACSARGDNSLEVEDAPSNTAYVGRQSVDIEQVVPMQETPPKSVPQAQEQVTEWSQEIEKLSPTRPSEDGRRNRLRGSHTTTHHTSPKSEERFSDAVAECEFFVHEEAHHPSTHRYPSSSSQEHRPSHRLQAISDSTHSYGCEGDPSSTSQAHRKNRWFETEHPNSSSSRASASVPSADFESLSRNYKSVRHELQAKILLLEDNDHTISSLKAEIAELRRGYADQSRALSSVRHELRLCQSQLDNVQRFVSTADTHAEQDIIQKLQTINEMMYQASMTMADYVVESLMRQSIARTQTKEQTAVGEVVLEAIGPVMARYLATVKKDDDLALCLQIAFQCYFAHLLQWIVSSWTDNPGLNILITETYQRLRRAETQAICGRWRSLTRAHILTNSVSNPKLLLQQTIAGVSDIVVAAGCVTSKPDAESKLTAKFGDKIMTIVSHAGKFSNMVADMVSGDFEVFTVPSGVVFQREWMKDMNEVPGTPQGEAQIVLCASRVGLRKWMGEKAMVLTKAQVVLQSFLE